MKGKGASHANAEKRRADVLELDLHGFSESQIAKKLDVSQQTVSRDISLVRERETRIRNVSTLHTYQRSYAMWRNLLGHCWRLLEETDKVSERRNITQTICNVQRNIDERFLHIPSTTDDTDHSEEYKDETLNEAQRNAKTAAKTES